MRNKLSCFMVVGFLLVQLLFLQCSTSPNSRERIPIINSDNIRDYVCIVNRHLHPNMERYLDTLIKGFIKKGDEDSDSYARTLEGIRRGGSGSGFVYLNRKGSNYIITNYHVIVGAYRLSATFENDNGEKIIIKNLSVLNVDESADLAILALPDDQRSFRKGIPLSKTQLRSGDRIGAAGYPGVSGVPTWTYYPGYIGNPHVIPPGEESWFLQHNADINPGNSGGPLLVEDKKSPVRYSVVGINTMQIEALQGANYAIPTERVEAFIQRSFEQIDERVALENRIAAFMELLEKSTTSMVVYKDLSSFLSSTMINANPGQTVLDTPNSAKNILEKVIEDPVVGIAWAVAYNKIEDHIYNKSLKPLAQKILPEVTSIEPNNMSGYTSRLLVNGYLYRAEWIQDYGTWKLNDFFEDDGEYNDYHRLAVPHPLGKKVIYSLSSARDFDWYTLNIPKAGRLTVRTEGNMDTVLDILYDPSVKANMERPIATNDDHEGRGVNALVSADVRAGTVYVVIRLAGGSPGEYILLAGLDGELDTIPDTATTTGSASITIVNRTGFPVNALNIMPATETSWGQNRLSSNQTINSGQSVSVRLPYPLNQVSRYNIRLVDTDGDIYTKRNVQVTANGRVEFTSRDMGQQ